MLLKLTHDDARRTAYAFTIYPSWMKTVAAIRLMRILGGLKHRSGAEVARELQDLQNGLRRRTDYDPHKDTNDVKLTEELSRLIDCCNWHHDTVISVVIIDETPGTDPIW